VTASRVIADPTTGRPSLLIDLKEAIEPLSELEEYQLQELLTGSAIVSLPPADYEVEFRVREVSVKKQVARLGGQLWGRHLISVQVVGVLLLVALVGAVAIVVQGRGQRRDEGDGTDG
jgi:hypothetical protein